MLSTVILATLLVSTCAQSFSFGTALGNPFESQRSGAADSPKFQSSRTSALNFEDFFSSSKVASSPQRSSVRTAAFSTVSANQSLRRPTTSSGSQSINSRGVPVAPRIASPTTTPTPFRQNSPSFNPIRTQTASSAPAARQRSSPNSRTPFQVPAAPKLAPVESIRVRSRGGKKSPKRNPDVSSRGRIQQETTPTPPPIPFSTATEVVDVRENLVGQSICARGIHGDACRQHLHNTAMSCTTGFCKECQQCGAVSSDLWPKCCREHFLCCRPLAKACQSCDNSLLKPFCKAAFGRC